MKDRSFTNSGIKRLGLIVLILVFVSICTNLCFAYILPNSIAAQSHTIYRYTIFMDFEPWEPVPQGQTKYEVGDAVVHEDTVYIVVGDWANSEVPPDQNCGAWQPWTEKKDFPINQWNANIAYKQRDRVVYNGEYYQARFSSLNEIPTTDSDNPWEKLVNNWDENTEYSYYDRHVGSEYQVFYNGFKYLVKERSLGKQPDLNYGSYFDYEKDWEILQHIIVVNWKNNITFGIGDEVLYNGVYYQAIKSTLDEQPNLNSETWMALEDTWNPKTSYKINQIVLYQGVLYKARKGNSKENPAEHNGHTDGWEIIYHHQG